VLRANRGQYLALDLGTTQAKAVLFDQQGRQVARAQREIRLHFPRPTWAEVEAHEWWQAIAAAAREVLTGRAEEVAAVAVSGLMHAVVPTDEEGKPLAPVMLWFDQRCVPQAERLRADETFASPVSGAGKAAVPFNWTYSAAKLLWLREECPAVFHAARWFLHAKDFLRAKLTGTFASDPSDARGTRLFDPCRQNWAPDKLQAIGVPQEKMPPLRPSTALAGEVTPEAAAVTGLRPGTPVGVGGSDVHCALAGADVYRPGRVLLYLGTAAWLVRFPADSPYSRREAFERGQEAVRWIGSTATTGGALRWCRDLLGGNLAYSDLEALAAKVPPGAEGLLFRPHLLGERAPHFDPHARGHLQGLTLAHGRAHLIRAVMEGCAYHLRLIGDWSSGGAEGDLVAVGGGTQSRLWLEIIASVLGRPLRLCREPEATALGAAMLAAVGRGRFPDLPTAAAAWVRMGETVEPNPSWQAVYEEGYERYREAAWG